MPACRARQTLSAGAVWTWPGCASTHSCLQNSSQQIYKHASHVQGQADPQCRGFLDLAKQAMACLVGSFFAEPSVAGLCLQLHAGPTWLSGQVTRNMVATLSDFLNDYGPVIVPRFLQM